MFYYMYYSNKSNKNNGDIMNCKKFSTSKKAEKKK